MPATSCKICASPRLKDLYLIHGYQISQCRDCGFGQVDITAEELAAFYDQSYFKGEKARFAQAEDEAIRPSHRYWLEHYLAAFDRTQPLRILDIGPGLGAQFGEYLRATYPHIAYEAVEISAFAAERLRLRGFTIHHGRVVDPHILDACRSRFDLIVGTEVIEHDPEPHAFVAAIAAMLKPGGRCAFTTGNLRGIVARTQGERWYYLDPPAHVSYYTPAAARKVFAAQGLTNIDVWKIGFNYITLKLRTKLPGILTLADLISLPTGMSLSAQRPLD